MSKIKIILLVNYFLFYFKDTASIEH